MKRPLLFDTILGASPNRQTGSRSRWIVWLSATLSIIFLYLALNNLNWVALGNTLSNVNYGFLLIVSIWSSVSYFIRALRWRVLLSAEKPISRQEAFGANMAGYLGNNIFPARVGELVRAIYVNRVAGISLSFALAVGLTERLMDVLVLVMLGSISLSASGIASGLLQQAIQVMAIMLGVGAVLFLFLPTFSPLLFKIIGGIHFLKPSTKKKITSILMEFLLGLRALLHPQRAATFSLYTVLIWLMDGLSVVMIGVTLHISIALVQSFVLLAGLGLSSAIPSTPGYIGIYQYVAVTVLDPFGISQTDALALIIMSQMLGYIVVIFWGLLSLRQFNKNTHS